MKNGNDDGYSYFLFAKSLPFDWNNTSNLYGSGADGSYWPISGQPNESAFGDEIPLYEGSKNSYRLPAGLYTVTVDLDYTHQYTTKSVKVTKRDVTMTISPASTFINVTRNVTMESNLTDLGGKIYYTTDGSNPKEQSNSNRHEYTGQLTISETTTIKAVAVLGCIYSEIVENTYTKLPATPEITPASCTFNEPLTVTITAEDGATIYYTTDGSVPSPENGTQYNGAFTVSTTTTVKARAYVGEFYSYSVAEVTYTYLQITTSRLAALEANPVEGESYLILDELTVGYVADDGTAYAKDADQDIEVPSEAHDYVATMLAERSHTNKTANWIAITGIDEVDEGQTIAANTLRGTLTDAVNFTLAVAQQPELSSSAVAYDVNTYIPCNFMGRSTQNGTNGKTYFFSTPQVDEFAHITNAVLASKTSGTSGEAGTYTMTIDSGTKNGENNVHWTANNSTLTWDDVSWNASYTGGKITNQNKWIQIGSQDNPSTQIVLTTTGFAGKTITSASLTGYCMSNEGPTLTITAGSATMLEDEPLEKQSSGTTNPAVYTTTSGPVSLDAGDALTFTINSTAHAGICLVGISVTYGDATGATGTFNLGTGAGVNTAGLEGEITVDLGSLGDSFNVGQMYSFDALIKTAAGGNGAPRRVAGNGNYSIQAVGNVTGNDIPTAVDELQSGKAVDGVRYVNVAGQVAATPWQGVNIVVTRYTDGSTRTTKVVR